MSLFCDYLTFDIMTDFVYGQDSNLLQSPEYRHLPHSVEKSNIRLSVLLYFPYLYLGRLDRIIFRDAVRGNKNIHNFINRVIEGRRPDIGGGRDVYAQLAGENVTERPVLTPEEVRSEALLLTISGTLPP